MRILSKNGMYSADKYTSENLGISPVQLMENAGQALSIKILGRVNKECKICVLSGTGNNGGDGIVIARILHEKGYNSSLWIIPPTDKISASAAEHLNRFINSGGSFRSYIESEKELLNEIESADVIIDCLFGIGMSGVLKPPYDTIISEVNKSKAYIIAIDVPSGVNADFADAELAVRADVTLTIQCPKRSAFLFPARNYYGELIVVDIGIPDEAVEKAGEDVRLWDANDYVRTHVKRLQDSHKGTHGRMLLVGGSENMPGAVSLAARSALRGGIGLLTVAAPKNIIPIVAGHILEATYLPCTESEGGLQGEIKLDKDYDCIVMGPGLGRTEGVKNAVLQILRYDKKTVMDADALYFLPEFWEVVKKRTQPLIITPHMGEMARLCGMSIEEVQKNRFTVASELAIRNRVEVVLKGPYTITALSDGSQTVNSSGNPALAKGGSGDILAGLIGAFIAQKGSLATAISNAVFLHGYSADIIVSGGKAPEGILASDIIEKIPDAMSLLIT
ncbi:MAG: NAD(P)H-hydrate dehydratase [Bacillota bacterium]|nr:NAD(P)H-hydrate dehydratase [Bacillota bacterium]